MDEYEETPVKRIDVYAGGVRELVAARKEAIRLQKLAAANAKRPQSLVTTSTVISSGISSKPGVTSQKEEAAGNNGDDDDDLGLSCVTMTSPSAPHKTSMAAQEKRKSTSEGSAEDHHDEGDDDDDDSSSSSSDDSDRNELNITTFTEVDDEHNSGDADASFLSMDGFEDDDNVSGHDDHDKDEGDGDDDDELGGFISLHKPQITEESEEDLLTTLAKASPPGRPPWFAPYMQSDGQPGPDLLRRSRLPALAQLHEEILDFVEFIKPTPEEEAKRSGVVRRIQDVMKGLWPKAQLLPFGSYVTELYLPFSDIDLILVPSEDMEHVTEESLERESRRQAAILHFSKMGMKKKPAESEVARAVFEDLSNALMMSDMISDVEIVASARVPIVKFTDNETGYRVDICFNNTSGQEAVTFMRNTMDAMPALRPLTLLLKYFMHVRGLNETYTGGIGSFMLQLMIIAMLQRHECRYKLQPHNMVKPLPKVTSNSTTSSTASNTTTVAGLSNANGVNPPSDSTSASSSSSSSAVATPASAETGNIDSDFLVADIDSHMNLGVLLYSFFDMFGNKFNYEHLSISVSGVGSIFNKVRFNSVYVCVCT